MGDGYGIKGKFTSNTGASSSKSKSYGYKGKKKKAPKTTKTYGQTNKVTGDPSKDKSESTTSANAKAASTADLTQYVKDEQKYEEAVASGTENDSWVQGKDYWKDQEGKIYTDVHARNLADYDISKAKEKASSVADLQLEADINTGWEKAVAEQSLQQEVIDNKTYEQSQTDTTPTTTTTSTKDDSSTPTTTPTVSIDMSSKGDEDKPTKTSSSATNTGGGGTATDMEEIAELPQKLKSAYRRKAKRKGKRDLRVQKDTGLNIPASSSGLSIPT